MIDTVVGPENQKHARAAALSFMHRPLIYLHQDRPPQRRPRQGAHQPVRGPAPHVSVVVAAAAAGAGAVGGQLRLVLWVVR